MRKKPEIVEFGKLAEYRTDVVGWMCKKCNRFYGNDERSASWCCATHSHCERCKKLVDKYRTLCQDCVDAAEHKKWEAKPAVQWDGSWPIVDWRTDKYFFSEEDLWDAWDSSDEPDPLEWLKSLKLCSCAPNTMRQFEVNEWCSDDLPDDMDVPNWKEIDERINSILGEIGTLSWYMTGQKLSLDSILAHLSLPTREKETEQ